MGTTQVNIRFPDHLLESLDEWCTGRVVPPSRTAAILAAVEVFIAPTYTWAELTEAMREYNAQATPGSECAAWQDYVETAHPCGNVPWDGEITGDQVPHDVADYWLAVASGESSHYVSETGERIPGAM